MTTSMSAAAAAPAERAEMEPAARKRAERAAAKAMQRLWKQENGVISYLGGEASAIAAPGTYENFEMWIDFRTAGKAVTHSAVIVAACAETVP